jgi:hypothetical protein
VSGRLEVLPLNIRLLEVGGLVDEQSRYLQQQEVRAD